MSNAFGQDKRRVLLAMQWAAAQWEREANIKFHYLPQYDGQCSTSPSRPRLFIPVQLRNECGWHASAAYPFRDRGQPPHRVSYVKVNTRALGRCSKPVLFELPGLMLHELGHVLGFVHERDRRENADDHDNDRCFPTNLKKYEAITAYDPRSIMHYSECGGIGPNPAGHQDNNTTMSSQVNPVALLESRVARAAAAKVRAPGSKRLVWGATSRLPQCDKCRPHLVFAPGADTAMLHDTSPPACWPRTARAASFRANGARESHRGND